MKNEKDNIDKLIKEALTEEEATFYQTLEEKDLFGKLGAIYRGKLGWLTGLVTFIQLILFVLAVVCLVYFLEVQTTEELIKWGAGGFLCLMSVTMLKLFIWMQMDKNDILRELKKLELLFVSIADKTKQ